MTPISICIITKNECEKLERCLKSIVDFFCDYPYEIVLTDTGSTDGTMEMVKKYTDRIFEFEWIKDFSAARNFTISKARYDWILSLDSDQYIEKIELKEINRLMEENPNSIGILYSRSEEVTGNISVERARRLFNKNLYHYERTVHEQIMPIDKSFRRSEFYMPLTIFHDGYNGTAEELEEKAMRDIELLQISLEQTENPADDFLHYTYFQIGQSYVLMSQPEKSIPYFEKALACDLTSGEHVTEHLIISYVYALFSTGEKSAAIQFMENIADLFTYYADFIYTLGFFHYDQKHYGQALKYFISAMQQTYYITEGTNSFMPLFYIGMINYHFGDIESARNFFLKCGDFSMAKEALRQLDANAAIDS